MSGIDTGILWRAALVQLVAVAVLSIALALALPKSFFEDYGWISGPLAWLLCAVLTARVLRLPPAPTLLGAVLAGLPSLLFVVIGLHWAGAVVAVGFFAVWCARLSPAAGAPSSPPAGQR
ncbi:MAG TPA: hypothetical protein VFB52_04915 [Solirubrobacterales bacterium]|nr:hypothetical protein [Solirubrobacterales bacterium]